MIDLVWVAWVVGIHNHLVYALHPLIIVVISVIYLLDGLSLAAVLLVELASLLFLLFYNFMIHMIVKFLSVLISFMSICNDVVISDIKLLLDSLNQHFLHSDLVDTQLLDHLVVLLSVVVRILTVNFTATLFEGAGVFLYSPEQINSLFKCLFIFELR